MSVMEIIHEIDTLPAPERWQVLEHTRQTFEPAFESDDVPAEHKKIVSDRLAAYRNGEMEAIPHDEFMRRYRARRASQKQKA